MLLENPFSKNTKKTETKEKEEIDPLIVEPVPKKENDSNKKTPLQSKAEEVKSTISTAVNDGLFALKKVINFGPQASKTEKKTEIDNGPLQMTSAQKSEDKKDNKETQPQQSKPNLVKESPVSVKD